MQYEIQIPLPDFEGRDKIGFYMLTNYMASKNNWQGTLLYHNIFLDTAVRCVSLEHFIISQIMPHNSGHRFWVQVSHTNSNSVCLFH